MENVVNAIKIILEEIGAIHVIPSNFKMNLLNGQVETEKLMNLFNKYNLMQINIKKFLNGFHLADLKM